MLIAIFAKNKLGMINGLIPHPKLDDQTYASWNDMVISWLLNSLSKDIANSVIYSRTVKYLWIGLKERFGQSNGVKLYHLRALRRI